MEMWRRRYCWLHGVTRILSTTLSNLHSLLDKKKLIGKEFKKICQEYQDSWEASGKSSALIAKIAKKMLRGCFVQDISNLFEKDAQIKLKWSNNPLEWTVTEQQAVLLVLDSIRIFHDFAYIKWPSDQAFEVLWQARNGLLAVYAVNEWELTPTIHFMLNEAIHFAKMDKTAYFSIQESIEHQNQVDKKDSKKTSHSSTPLTNLSSWQQMLNHQQLRRSISSKFTSIEQSLTNNYLLLSKTDIRSLEVLPK